MSNKKYSASYEDIIPYFSIFLHRYSKSNVQSKRNKMIDFALFVKETLNKDILDVDVEDILAYFGMIDQKDIKKVTKVKYRHILNSYYNLVLEIKHKKKEEFFNPVPSRSIWDFSGEEELLDFLEREEHLLDIKSLNIILNHLWFTRPKRIWIAVYFIILTGARVSEIMHIELKNLDIQNRWVVTRIKSQQSKKRDGIYFFPEYFAKELKSYVEELKMEHPNAKYLFQQGDSFLHPGTIRKHLRTVKEEKGLQCNMNPHTFRDFINTKRSEKGCPDKILSFLLMQKVSDVNAAHYLKKYKYRMKLRIQYDKYNPFPKLMKPDLKMKA